MTKRVISPVSSFHEDDCNSSEDDPAAIELNHPLVSWFDREVRKELKLINMKLDKLSQVPRRQGRLKTTATVTADDSKCAEAPKANTFRESKQSIGWTVLRQSPRTATRSDLEKSLTLESKIAEIRARGTAMCDSSEKEKTNNGGDTSQNFPAAVVLPVPSSPGVAPSGETKFDKKNSVGSTDTLRDRDWNWSFLRTAWDILENPDSSATARWFANLMPVFLMLTVVAPLLQTFDPPLLITNTLAASVLDTLFDSLFLLEFIVRFMACPNHRSFFKDAYNLIDFAAAIPLGLRASVGFHLDGFNDRAMREVLLLGVPLVRFLKPLRRFEKFHLLVKALEDAIEALPVLLYMLFFMGLLFAVLLYLAEPRDHIEALPTAFWATIVTMTTVGYGDIVPISGIGRSIVGVLVVITMLYMAVPLGIVGNAFTDVWKDRHRLLLLQRTRDRLLQWGYTARDIPSLFKLSDTNGDGELNPIEFRELLTHMNLGFSEEVIFDLFRSFDTDGSDSVDHREFAKALYPGSYHEIYEAEEILRQQAEEEEQAQNQKNEIEASISPSLDEPVVIESFGTNAWGGDLAGSTVPGSVSQKSDANERELTVPRRKGR